MPISQFRRERGKKLKLAKSGKGQGARRRAQMFAGSPNCGLCGKPMIVANFKEKLKNIDDKWLAATIDHIVPKSKGGTNTPDNYMLVHRLCNAIKGSLSLEEFRERQANGTLPKRAALTELYVTGKIEKLLEQKSEDIPWWYC